MHKSRYGSPSASRSRLSASAPTSKRLSEEGTADCKSTTAHLSNGILPLAAEKARVADYS
eukprot:2321238-Lingulodinium_polyedra.AAC.1